jgi:EAL domain-containing protein (putative c-di-GMP-specific phosphodiesterase class I)
MQAYSPTGQGVRPSELTPKPAAGAGVVSAFQPILELETRSVAGYEALARWDDPSMSDVSRVFQEARAGGYLAELDWTCRLAAFNGALSAGLSTDFALFVNVEPTSMRQGEAPAGFDTILRRAESELRVVVELTERSLLDGPGDVLWLVRWARERGWGVALDDVGAHPDMLAMLPFIAPDIIKLDLSLIQQTPSRDQARTITAVMAHSEETGAAVLAEGIETEADLEQALSLGATLGQGWLFGRPGPLPSTGDPASLALPQALANAPVTPFDLVGGHTGIPTRIARKQLLEPLVRRLEILATNPMDPPVVLSAFQTAEQFTAVAARRYADLARTSPIVGAFAVGMSSEPAPRVRGTSLSPSDPLADEWTIVLIGSHHAAAFIARDVGDQRPELDRRYEYAVTHDRSTVLAAGRSLMNRFIAAGGVPVGVEEMRAWPGW